MSAKTKLVISIAQKLKSYGYTVYLSKDGRYGFYTDGKRVVCFGGQWEYTVDFYGSYRSKHCGSGWKFENGDMLSDIDSITAERFITAYAPAWATRGESVTYTTPEKHLNMYGSSSGYSEFKGDE